MWSPYGVNYGCTNAVNKECNNSKRFGENGDRLFECVSLMSISIWISCASKKLLLSSDYYEAIKAIQIYDNLNYIHCIITAVIRHLHDTNGWSFWVLTLKICINLDLSEVIEFLVLFRSFLIQRNVCSVSDFGINSILFQRGIYPPETFKNEEHFGLSIYVSSDEKINTFLQSVLGQIKGK